MLPASAENETDTNRNLKRWGPIGAIAVAAIVVIALVVTGGGDDDDDPPAADDTVDDAGDVAPTEPADDDVTTDDLPDATDPPDADPPDDTDPPAEPGDDPNGDDGDHVPVVLSFSRAAELGIEVDWGERCDTSTGRVAVPDFFGPECYAPFTGDNGGATDVGVTADTIRIV